MATIELRLNQRKPGNYAFFCPVTKLHLTLANPVGITDRVSPYILRALKSNTLVDVNGVIDLESGKMNVNNNTKKTETKTEPVKSEATATPDQKEESSQVTEAAVEEKKTTNKRGKRAQTNPVDEAAE